MAREPVEVVPEEDIRVEGVPATALEVLNRGEVEMQMSFARRYPRSITECKREAMTLATEDPEVAKTMFYSVPRGGKRIEGPSVRLAEIIAYAWGHMRVAARDLEVEDKVCRAQSLCWDIQRNVAVSVEATRKITKSDGTRYGDDMIATTMASARSVAFRNAVFKVVPFSHVKSIYEKAKLVALGEGMDMKERRAKVLGDFVGLGGKESEALAILDLKNVNDMTVDDCVALLGLNNAIRSGETSLSNVLGEMKSQPTKIAGLTLAGIAGGKVAEAEDTPDEEPKAKEEKKETRAPKPSRRSPGGQRRLDE